jgi:hypothetical protein
VLPPVNGLGRAQTAHSTGERGTSDTNRVGDGRIRNDCGYPRNRSPSRAPRSRQGLSWAMVCGGVGSAAAPASVCPTIRGRARGAYPTRPTWRQVHAPGTAVVATKEDAWMSPRRSIVVNLPRCASNLGTVNVTKFSDVPDCRLIRGKGAKRGRKKRAAVAADRRGPQARWQWRRARDSHRRWLRRRVCGPRVRRALRWPLSTARPADFRARTLGAAW